MYEKLKQDMRDAGIDVTDGDALDHTDLQKVRDFLYFRGINIGEHFDRYEEALEAMDPEVVAAKAAEDKARAEAAAEAKRLADEQAAEQAEKDAEAAKAAAEQAAQEQAEKDAEAARLAEQAEADRQAGDDTAE